jgi:hypothetical protein
MHFTKLYQSHFAYAWQANAAELRKFGLAMEAMGPSSAPAKGRTKEEEEGKKKFQHSQTDNFFSSSCVTFFCSSSCVTWGLLIQTISCRPVATGDTNPISPQK